MAKRPTTTVALIAESVPKSTLSGIEEGGARISQRPKPLLGAHFKPGADSDGLVWGAFDRAMNMLGQWRRQTVRASLAFLRELWHPKPRQG
jgi:hypothetical protein